MTKIELRDGYFIEVDEMNATLKQKYIEQSLNIGKLLNRKLLIVIGKLISRWESRG